MEFLSALSDDQKALLGCFAAFATCGAIMALSIYLRGDQKKASRREVSREMSDLHISRARTTQTAEAEKRTRKAA